MSNTKPRPSAADDALTDFYVQAVLDASGEELRAEAIAMGEDPTAMVAEATAAFQAALARCEVTAEAWPDGAGSRDASSHSRDAANAAIPGDGGTVSGYGDPFVGLDARGLRAAAASFGCNTNFIGRLKDRLVRIEDLTDGFVAALAGALGVGAASLVEFLRGPARVPAMARFKADGKPTASDKQSLDEALEASGMSEDQIRRLRAL